jgi:peptidoglycan/xylan/chitin deacetylase (PgdA/CDA1 family)
MPSPNLLRTCFDILHFSGMTKLLTPLFQGRGIIFCLHQVLPDGGKKTDFSPNHQLEISTRFLDEALHHISGKGYRLLSLEDAALELQNGAKNKPPFAVFTLDDGYRDNMVYAAPIFKKHRCPYTIFITAGYADGNCEIWWKALEHIIAHNQKIEFDGTTIETTTAAQKNHAWQDLLMHLKAMPELDQRKWLRDLAASHRFDLNAQCQSLAMTWDEIRSLSHDPLCTFGAHTLNHYAVARLPVDAARRQISESAKRLVDELGKPVTTFAYPYGDMADAGQRDFQLAAECNFAVSVTTRKGNVYTAHKFHPQALPRVMMSGRYQDLRYLDALMSGVPLALLNGFRKVNVQ